MYITGHMPQQHVFHVTQKLQTQVCDMAHMPKQHVSHVIHMLQKHVCDKAHMPQRHVLSTIHTPCIFFSFQLHLVCYFRMRLFRRQLFSEAFPIPVHINNT